jgi:hypothetical protein
MRTRLSLSFSFWLLGMAALARPAQAQTVPGKMSECEGTRCDGIWTFNGQTGSATWASGARANLTVERFEAVGILIRRIDVSGTTPGLTAVYTGKLSANHIEGDVTWTWPGHWNKPAVGKWSATIDGPAPVSVAMPQSAAKQPATAASRASGAAPQSPPIIENGLSIPPLMHFCAVNCMTLQWNNGRYIVTTTAGWMPAPGTSIWTLEKFTRESVVLHRRDSPSGFDVVFTGAISKDGNELVNLKGNDSPVDRNTRLTWGTALNSIPGSNEERDQRNAASATPPTPASQAVGRVSGQEAAASPNIPPDRPTELRLTGIWEAKAKFPDGTRRVVGQVRVQQDGSKITMIQIPRGNAWNGLAVFEGRLTGKWIEGHVRDTQSTPQSPRWGATDKLFIDDSDHLHGEGKQDPPMYRAHPDTYDLPCDTANKWHTDSWYAFVRGHAAYNQHKDYAAAVCWYKIATELGEARAPGMLALALYRNGDYPEATALAKKTVDRGDASAMQVLATAYAEGKGVAADTQKAAYWSRMAAEQRGKQVWNRVLDVITAPTVYEPGDLAELIPREQQSVASQRSFCRSQSGNSAPNSGASCEGAAAAEQELSDLWQLLTEEVRILRERSAKLQSECDTGKQESCVKLRVIKQQLETDLRVPPIYPF